MNSVRASRDQEGMVMPFVLAILLVCAAVLGAWFASSREPSVLVTPSPQDEMSATASPTANMRVLEFSMAGYTNAVKTGKLVVLYYDANWCALCKEEFSKFQTAIAALADLNVVAFRVNFNDSDTDSDEKTAAKTFRVASEHTIVIVKDGKAAFSSATPVDYLATIGKHLH